MNSRHDPDHFRSFIRAKNGMVVSSSPFATNAALEILNLGGNAFDALVSAGLCLNVVHSDMTNFGGIASIMLYIPKENRITTIAGVASIFFIQIQALQEFAIVIILIVALSVIAAAMILPAFFDNKYIK